MALKTFSHEKFKAMPIVGIMRNFKQSDIENILPEFAGNGLNTIEVTMNSPGAVESIQFALKNFGDQLNVGAGTVCTENDLDVALGAGAQFIVTPIVDLMIIERCKRLSVPIFAGAYTPTEIFTAWTAGADMVKVFPMVGDAIEYIKAIRGPLPQVKLLPTGGVNADNVSSFFKAGASGVGAGGQLFDKKYIEKKDWPGLGKHFALFAQKVSSV
ncbi:MAG: bifunctional 4-hydroxy-2-oxoglutarate aldolase/2-dehydro-3-deoxy-phosphogluconate aldolase [Chitinophagaceae bacterium]|nr:bifunctional 4-hydroxy-2-oxoglutarate aldolase/2-dehydro-3-deoxy-phosphogluconate aldolase [Chitinophagaceae bacterium]